MANPIRIVIVEDSPTARMLLRELIETQPDMTVVGEASNGARGIELACELRPDLVVMDVHMPGMTGIEATSEIMRRSPRPIVVVSSSMNVREHPAAFEAVRVGALMVLDKPRGVSPSTMAAVARDFTDMLRALSGVRVLRAPEPRPTPSGRLHRVSSRPSPEDLVIALGTSTGGPAAVQAILSGLPAGFPTPILLTQHITPGFTASYAAWLNQRTKLDVRLARNGARLESGVVYVAPEDCHLGMRADRTIRLLHDPPYRGQRPSVNRMFESLAAAVDSNAVAVQMTGMGDDGAEGCEAVTAAGGLVIAQDPATAVISSMPDSALRRCPRARTVPLGDIANVLCDLTGSRHHEPAACASGSATSISLPTIAAVTPPSGSPAAAGSATRSGHDRDGSAPRRAMVVDDSRTFRLILVDAIARSGFTVTEAGSAADARRLIEARGVPHLLVIDWQMPGISGVDFVRELRARPECRQMQILMVTSVRDADHIEMASSAGVDAYVTKPFTDSDLDDALRRLYPGAQPG